MISHTHPFFRASKGPRLVHYNRLIALVVLVNGALLARHLAREDWHVADGSVLSGLADLIVVNFAIAVLIRQQHVLNVIFAAAGRGSSRWPLRLRWMISKVNHIGGLHVGRRWRARPGCVPLPWSPRSLAPAGLRPSILRPSRWP